MIKYFLLVVVTMVLLVSCKTHRLEVGECNEYMGSLVCDDEQLTANRNMIDKCVNRGGLYSRCVHNIHGIGCVQETFVVCRQDVNQFVTYTNKSEKIKGKYNADRLDSQNLTTSSTLPDTINNKPTSDWYNEGDIE